MKVKKIFVFVLALAISYLAGFLGSIFNGSNIQGWYSTIIKPSFNPPNYVFGPVWTLLFTLIGVALYLIWQTEGKRVRKKYMNKAMLWFIIQWILNVLWSFLFFTLHNPLLALVGIVLLLISIFMTIWYFYKLRRIAGILLIPYFGWVSFAMVLNLSIWLLNK